MFILCDITFESPYDIEFDNPLSYGLESDAGPQIIRQDVKQQWKYGTFNCFDNWSLCILATFVPCVPFGETSGATAHGNCLHQLIMILKNHVNFLVSNDIHQLL